MTVENEGTAPASAAATAPAVPSPTASPAAPTAKAAGSANDADGPGTDPQEPGAPEADADGDFIEVKVILPDQPPLALVIPKHECVVDIVRYLLDSPSTNYFSAYTLHFQGRPLQPTDVINDVEGLENGSEIVLVEGLYNEMEVRVHIQRTLNQLEGRSLFRDAASDMVSPTVLAAIPSSLPDDDQPMAIPNDSTTLPASPARHLELLRASSETPSTAGLYPPNFAPSLPACVRRIDMSPWNPPTAARRLAGDLCYLVVETTTLKQAFHVTSHVGGFYVNRSNAGHFDPRPAARPCAGTNLVAVFRQLDPEFAGAMDALAKRTSAISNLVLAEPTYPVRPWALPSLDVEPSPSRAATTLQVTLDNLDLPGQASLAPGAGGQARDFNDEFQSLRELPNEPQEALVAREQALFRLTGEFIQAATAAAVAVVHGNAVPLAGTDVDDTQIFLFNNIFLAYTSGAAKTQPTLGGEVGAHVAASKECAAVAAIDRIRPAGVSTLLNAVVDYAGKRLVAQAIIPGAVRGSSKPNEMLYGVNEPTGTITAHPSLDDAMTQIADSLRLAKHTVVDSAGTAVELRTSVDVKAITGGDRRAYLLEVVRVTPLDINFLSTLVPVSADADAGTAVPSDRPEAFGKALGPFPPSADADVEWPSYPHRTVLLRHELVSTWYEDRLVKATRKVLARRTAEAQAQTADPLAAPAPTYTLSAKEVDDEAPLRFNPDLFVSDRTTPADVLSSPEAQASIDVADLLLTVLVPLVATEIVAALPLDSASFARLCHYRGVNMRYLGAIARKLEAAEQPSDRSAKALVR